MNKQEKSHVMDLCCTNLSLKNLAADLGEEVVRLQAEVERLTVERKACACGPWVELKEGEEPPKDGKQYLNHALRRHQPRR